MNKPGKASAIIVAAGKGSRMNSSVNKQYLLLDGKPVLAHTLDSFENSGKVSEIIVVIHEDDRELFEECILKRFHYAKITSVVNGGKERQSSVYQGLLQVCRETRILLVHDGARPLVTTEIIDNSITIAEKTGAACVGVPVKDTIKKADETHIVEETLNRSRLWAIQTPQVFQREILVRAHESAAAEGFLGTDDSVLAERLGYPVQMVMGSYTNIKITTPEDLIYAEAILAKRKA